MNTVNYLILEFDVDARYGNIVDRTVEKTQGATFALTGGLLYPITRRLDIGAEVFYTPLSERRPQNDHTTVESLVNVRGLIAYRFF